MSLWQRILIFLIGTSFFSITGRAEASTQKETKTLSFFEELDASFGEYIVAPLGSIMFYDVSFWDNNLPFGEGVGEVIAGKNVLGFEAGEYSLIPQFVVPVEELNQKEKLKPEEIIVFQHGEKQEKGKIIRLEEKIQTRFLKSEQGKTVRHQIRKQIAIIEGLEVIKSNQPLPNPRNMSLPFVVIWLIFGAIYFTFRMGFINIRGFWHSIQVVRGDFEQDSADGDVSHFQAFSSALSATVGLGNIAGVAIAVSIGGPGAIFWMIIAAFLVCPPNLQNVPWDKCIGKRMALEQHLVAPCAISILDYKSLVWEN